MPNTIHCPQCNRELRVPDELLGKKVKCPACSTTFTASIAASEAEPPPLTPVGSEPARLQPAPDESPDAARGFQEDYQRPSGPPRDRSRGLAVMRAPAICLLVSSIISLLVVGYFMFAALVLTRGQLEAQMQAQGKVQTAQEKEAAEKMFGLFIGPGPAIFHLFFIGVNLVIILSSIMMLIGKMRWLAVLGSVLAILNFDCGCCLLGVPFGIWSLVALNNPAAKEAFK
jgi:predicted Zn finger-like uncharacterized protein